MLRPEYCERSKDLLAFCTEEELNVLAQQATKELNKRIAAYTGKLDIDENHKKTVSRRKAKERAYRDSKSAALVSSLLKSECPDCLL